MQQIMQDQSPKARWLRAMNNLRAARMVKPLMNDLSISRQQRDEAIAIYARALDALALDLGLMLETGALEEVADFLDITFGGRA